MQGYSSQVVQPLLSAAGLSAPDRRPLHQYPCSSEQIADRGERQTDPAVFIDARFAERVCGTAPEIAILRSQGLWTDLHDRVAEYPPFLRAQEHSAQILRPMLKDYECAFKEGDINVLNCTTTMEMGVDIPNVALVINANVPPSVANYRQRVGRAGWRGEPFAFAATFCRDLPWDRIAFAAPARYLSAKIAAPAVRLDSPRLVARHVHAALPGFFLRAWPEGFNIKTSVGAFFGATDNADAPVGRMRLSKPFSNTWAKPASMARRSRIICGRLRPIRRSRSAARSTSLAKHPRRSRCWSATGARNIESCWRTPPARPKTRSKPPSPTAPDACAASSC